MQSSVQVKGYERLSKAVKVELAKTRDWFEAIQERGKILLLHRC